ncbi:hypothetical protein ACFFX0_14170 [Citricoccus parietis]|uniref:Uncharacterized protein n=1 Tax=Citricoccus parietis TaxID=592307 RepID=A0ABV5G037_9MICC
MRSPRWAGRCRPHRPGRTIQREDTASGPIASRVTPGSIRPTSILTGQSQTSQIQTHRWPRWGRWRCRGGRSRPGCPPPASSASCPTLPVR